MPQKIAILALALLLPLEAAFAFKGLSAPEASDPSGAAAAHSGMHHGGPSGSKDGVPMVDKMIARLNERLAHEPDNLPARIMLASIYKEAGRADEAARTSAEVDQRLAALVERVRQNPGSDDLADPLLLADAYNMLGRYGDAVSVYAAIENKIDSDPDLLIDYAETLAQADPQSLVGKPLELAERALKINPRHLSALLFAATAAEKAGDKAKVAAYWETALPLVEPGSALEKDLRDKLDALKRAD
ncbi:MAG: hypothetical protein LBE62_04530 [Azonexus sp.]|nr:hypothetical protein [Azonexus sp.]